jgi:hypothetical protein
MNKFIFLTVMACVLSLPKYALSQVCNAALQEQLQICTENALDSCGDSVTECSTSSLAPSLRDVEERAINSCCLQPKPLAHIRCLRRERRSYLPNPRNRRGVHTNWLRNARIVIRDLIENQCYQGAYSQVF